MEKISRRELLQRAGAVVGTTGLSGFALKEGIAAPAYEGAAELRPSFEWIRSARLLIAEGYAPPFYPSLDYEPKKALAIARRLNCDSIRYPTYSYVAFFPTKAQFPCHPELGSRDPFRETVNLFHDAGLKVVAYNPLNHPFMDVQSNNPDYLDWARYGPDGRPYITRHMGWTQFYEGCLNSPLRKEIRARVREVVSNYPVDLMYFDGPYQGMDQAMHFCYCKYCQAAYQKARGRSVPLQNAATTLEDRIEYEQWMTGEVVLGFMREVCDMVRQVRDVPIVYNDTCLLAKDVRARAFRYTDGFMFEAAEMPEEKLFNMRLGQSTGKVIWTYVSSHTEYNCEHLKDNTVRGWYSASVDGNRLQLDAAVATAAGVGYCYWGLNRLFYLPHDILGDSSIKGLKAVFDFAQRNEGLLRSVLPQPQAGILTGAQTIQWYKGAKFVPKSYRNYYYGAFQILKDLGYDAEPFLDFEVTAERLAKYRLVYVPNAPCLSAAQCARLESYVKGGGTLLATHRTSLADEFGRPRPNYGLAGLFGAILDSPEPEEIPDLYLRILPSAGPNAVEPLGERHSSLHSPELIPQDPQVMLFRTVPGSGSEVLAETYDRGHRRTLGPAVIARRHGEGRVIYIGSGLEAIYEETLNGSFRTYFHSLLDPILMPAQTYDIEYRPGLMSQFASSTHVMVLHLLANVGNIWKKRLVQESFLPLGNVRVRLRLPQGRTAKSVALLWSGAAPSWNVREGWVELIVPQVQVYEVIRVALGS